MISGLGEAALDRALADPVWLRERLKDVDAGAALRAKAWGAAAIVRAELHVRWAQTEDRAGAVDLERAALDATDLWNRLR